MSRAKKKSMKLANKPNLIRTLRKVLPLEPHYWSCFDSNGCITMTAGLWAPDHYGKFLVYISVWDADDTGCARLIKYPNAKTAQDAYERAVEIINRAPNPLPQAWIQINGLNPE